MMCESPQKPKNFIINAEDRLIKFLSDPKVFASGKTFFFILVVIYLIAVVQYSINTYPTVADPELTYEFFTMYEDIKAIMEAGQEVDEKTKVKFADLTIKYIDMVNDAQNAEKVVTVLKFHGNSFIRFILSFFRIRW